MFIKKRLIVFDRKINWLYVKIKCFVAQKQNPSHTSIVGTMNTSFNNYIKLE